MRRPVFIYDKNKVGGGEHLFLRRAESARRLGLDPVIITIPGPMDAAYRRTARLWAERGRAHSASLHGPARLDERLRALLSSPASRGPTLPCPWPEPHWLAWNILSGYPWRRLATEIVRT